MIRSTPSESNTTHVNRISFNVSFDMKVSKDEYHNFTVAKEAFCNSAELDGSQHSSVREKISKYT